MYTFNDALRDRMQNGIQGASALGGGVTWVGDRDNEILFGTDWNDILKGDEGNDTIYGFEGDDKLYGDEGNDKLFGDAGDDIIYAYGAEGNNGSKFE